MGKSTRVAVEVVGEMEKSPLPTIRLISMPLAELALLLVRPKQKVVGIHIDGDTVRLRLNKGHPIPPLTNGTPTNNACPFAVAP